MTPLIRARSLLPLLLAAGCAAAAAQDAARLQVRALAATCANCHGTDGRPPQGAAVPGLAGVPAAHLTERMQAFKASPPGVTVMHQIAKGYTDAQIAQLAAYFASLPRP